MWVNYRKKLVESNIVEIPNNAGFYYKLFWVRHKWRHISRFNFSNLLFGIFIWLCLVDEVILAILVSYFILTYCRTLYKIENIYKLWHHFERQRGFHLFDFYGFIKQKNYFCPHISERFNISEFVSIKLSVIRHSSV
jgi:hypothetical protein